MTEERWEGLVRKLEEVAREKPRAYRVRVGLLAGLGYGYVVLVVGLLLAAVAGVVALGIGAALALLKFAWPLLVLVAVALRAMWFRIPAPTGLEVSRADAPALWDVVERVREELDAPKVHRLLLDDELNAGVVQTPRFGPVGPQRNHLIVGLPLMQALSTEQFTAVLAHEFGHLSGNHSRFSGWIYRLRRTYGRLLEALEERRSRGIWLFRRFFEWYAPYFSAYSFALARQDEYVADRAAAEVAGVDAAAGALVRIELTASWMARRFWPDLHGRAEREPEAPRTAYGALRERLPLTSGADAVTDVRTALAAPTGIADTHPALGDRLAAVEVDPERALALAGTAPPRSAAAELLAEREQEWVEHFDASWRDEIGPAWRERHEEARAARERYDELRAAPPRDLDERFELAILTHRHEGPGPAVAPLRALAQEAPDRAPVRFWLGRALLETGDEAGLAELDRAGELDPDALIPACEEAISFLLAHDREPEADRYLARGQAHAQDLDRKAAARDRLTEADAFDVHGLPEEVLDDVREVLRREAEVKGALLAEKVVPELDPDDHVWVLALEPASRRLDGTKLVGRVIDRLALPGYVVVITLQGEYKYLRRKLGKVPGARIWPAGG